MSHHEPHAGHDAHAAHAAHSEHTPEHYGKIAKILMVLAAISYLGPMLGIQAVTLITAFGIACVKAFLVIKHFMHLTIEKKFVNYFLITAVAFMFLFFAGASPDVMEHQGRNWDNVAAKAETARAIEAHAAGGALSEGWRSWPGTQYLSSTASASGGSPRSRPTA